MDDGYALRRTIYEHPDDVTAVLVYADYLEERGHIEMATRLRVVAEPWNNGHRLAYAIMCKDRAYANYIKFAVELDSTKWPIYTHGATKEWLRRDALKRACLGYIRKHVRIWHLGPVCYACKGIARGDSLCFLCHGLGNLGSLSGLYKSRFQSYPRWERGFVTEVGSNFRWMFETSTGEVAQWTALIALEWPIERWHVGNRPIPDVYFSTVHKKDRWNWKNIREPQARLPNALLHAGLFSEWDTRHEAEEAFNKAMVTAIRRAAFRLLTKIGDPA